MVSRKRHVLPETVAIACLDGSTVIGRPLHRLSVAERERFILDERRRPWVWVETPGGVSWFDRTRLLDG